MILFEPFHLPFMARALVELLVLGALAGTVGVLVLLRRLAFVSDTLTHTVFPGVVIGHLMAGNGGIFWGALAAGVVTAVLLTLLTQRRRVNEDAALAMLLTTLFAVGVVLVSRQTGFTSDLTAFLFGRVLTVTEAQLAQTAVVTVVVVALLAVLRRPLLLRAFDPEGAQAAGVRVGLLDLVLNVAVALVVVAAVKAVGTVLVIALLIVPAAAARRLSDRLAVIVPLACVVGAAAGWLGLVVSYEASVGHGVRLASGATVVLVLVTMYVLAHVAGFVRRKAGLSRARRRSVLEAA
ncbi:metal ABC transporter permease [Microbispora bryophytorum]|uniref:Membrane protein n=1 Tax=Microbispora bryophytorum TaxID=1460882 RepID=A0A8H9GXV6_9ACTN|nr:metal ABC transporter permease [Microbispora bryophytorum]MBD3135334.1 metal ABC transporter permease [Microbispora bryophytorum]TQS09538.1 metal ABC transporter permease [Microbispora bryophytorum]GGN97082.1 membrane protein [Microbispora bryophytorum]